jgi:hypothetical protein
MNKYKVKVSHIFSELIDVEALDEKEAIEKAKKEIEIAERKAAAMYEVTLPPENWPVITEEKYNELINQEIEIQKNKAENNSES